MQQSVTIESSSAWSARIQLFSCYAIMVGLNGWAIVNYERAATDGYAYSYVQPDEKTFSIWGVIYSFLLILCFNANSVPPQARNLISFAFLLNGVWLIMNGLAVVNNLSYWAAVFILVAYAGTLWKAYDILVVDYKAATITQKICVYTPLSLNLAWVTLAAVLNFSNTVMNEKLDFTKKENRTAIGGPDWAMGVFVFASVIAVYLALAKSDVSYALGTIWALEGVVRQQTQGSNFPHRVSDQVSMVARSATIIVGTCATIGLGRSILFHAKKQLMKGDSVVSEHEEQFIRLNENKE